MKNTGEKEESFQAFLDNKIDTFVIDVIELTELMRKYRKLHSMSDQLIRSVTSIGANIHEARGCASRKEYTRYFVHSRKSSCETSYWLYLVKKLEPKLNIKAHHLHKRSIDIENILSSTILSLQSPPKQQTSNV